MAKKLLSFYLLLSFPIFVQAQSFKRIDEALTRLGNDEQLQNGLYSFCLLDAKSGKILYQKNDDIGLAPASCLKVATASTAFHFLGEDYQYHTLLGYHGNIDENGTLHGDLIIKGSGDPSLGSWRYDTTGTSDILKKWTGAIKEAGIKKIEGKIIGDDCLFDTQSLPGGWIWQDIGNYYGAGTSALCWRENQFDILLQPATRIGDPVKFEGTQPAINNLQFVNELTTGSARSGDQSYVYLAPYAHLAYLRGTSPANDKNFSISAAIPDPAYTCAEQLLDALQKINIQTSGSITTARLLEANKGRVPFIEHDIITISSPPLSKLIYWFLKRSINLYGEQLLKTVLVHEQQPVSTADGAEFERKYWKVRGISPNAMNIIDGSGLSPANRITTHTLATILWKDQSETWFPAFHEALPVINGIDMKSGYISGVRSYSGYIKNSAGRELIFSFIINNFNGSALAVRNKMWKVLDLLK